jgi:hypothetical protein
MRARLRPALPLAARSHRILKSKAQLASRAGPSLYGRRLTSAPAQSISAAGYFPVFCLAGSNLPVPASRFRDLMADLPFSLTINVQTKQSSFT